MGHDPVMTRKILVVIFILACGIVPDGLAGRGASLAARQRQEQPFQPG